MLPEERISLSSCTLSSVQERTKAYSKSVLAPGNGHSRCEVLHRLRLSKEQEVAARLHSFRVFEPAERPHPSRLCGDSISFLGAHMRGHREKMVQKPKD